MESGEINQEVLPCAETPWVFCIGGQSGAAVTCPHGNHQDVGSNPTAARNEKTDTGQTLAQKVPQ